MYNIIHVNSVTYIKQINKDNNDLIIRILLLVVVPVVTVVHIYIAIQTVINNSRYFKFHRILSRHSMGT